MQKLVAAALAAALISVAIPALAEDEVVAVTFASVVATPPGTAAPSTPGSSASAPTRPAWRTTIPASAEAPTAAARRTPAAGPC